MLSAWGRQWIAPDCWVGRVRNAGDDEPLHHLAALNTRGNGMEGYSHALQAGIERWRRVSPYFMVGGGRRSVEAETGKPDLGETMEARQWWYYIFLLIKFCKCRALRLCQGGVGLWTVTASGTQAGEKNVNAGKARECHSATRWAAAAQPPDNRLSHVDELIQRLVQKAPVRPFTALERSH
jgi:hypothetical protein